MGTALAEELFCKGLDALDHDHLYLARVCFEQSVEEDRTPLNCSYLAFSLAVTKGEFTQALALAEEAVARDPGNPVHYLNLGRVQIMSGAKDKGIATLRSGMRLGADTSIQSELEKLGIRKPPVFTTLPREHALNKYLGLFFTRIGLR